MVNTALNLVIQHFLNTPEVWVCTIHKGWDHTCMMCLEDADTLATLDDLREKFKNL